MPTVDAAQWTASPQSTGTWRLKLRKGLLRLEQPARSGQRGVAELASSLLWVPGCRRMMRRRCGIWWTSGGKGASCVLAFMSGCAESAEDDGEVKIGRRFAREKGAGRKTVFAGRPFERLCGLLMTE